jgi:hypothetical protein
MNFQDVEGNGNDIFLVLPLGVLVLTKGEICLTEYQEVNPETELSYI